MFKTAPIEPGPDVSSDCSPVPLSHLSLDLDPPPIGWVAYLNNVGAEILTDDVGRAAVHRHDARRLFDEHRRNEARQAELRARQEREAVEQDRLRRASLPTGIPAGMVPDGLAPAEAMMLAGESSAPRAKSVREQLLERELGSGESMVFNSFGPDVDEAS